MSLTDIIEKEGWDVDLWRGEKLAGQSTLSVEERRDGSSEMYRRSMFGYEEVA